MRTGCNKIFIVIFAVIVIFSGCGHDNRMEELDFSVKTEQITDSEYPCIFSYVENHQKKKTSVLVFLHGGGGNSESIFISNKKEINEMLNNPNGPSAIISITFGPFWMLGSKKLPDMDVSGNSVITIPISVFYELFNNQILPLFPDHNRSVSIMGISLGGYNTAQLAFRYPELFDKALILSPTYFPISPFSSSEDINGFALKAEKNYGGLKSFIKKLRTGSGKVETNVLKDLTRLRNKFETEQSWREDDLLTLLDRPNIDYPETYLSCGTNDPYALMDGTLALYNKLSELNTHSSFYPLKGEHYIIDWETIIRFTGNN